MKVCFNPCAVVMAFMLSANVFGDEPAIVDEPDAVDLDVVIAMPADPQTARLQQNLAVQRAFISRICKLTDDQQKKLKSMNNDWLGKLRNKVPAKAQNPGLIGVFFGVQPQRPAVAQQKNIQKEVDRQLVGLLDAEQKAKYEKEKEKRLAFRNEATTEALIESLQERLDITDEQREKLKKKILPWASRQGDMVLTMYFSGNNYFPQIPIHLLDALTDEQREAYQGLQRYLFTSDNFNK